MVVVMVMVMRIFQMVLVAGFGFGRRSNHFEHELSTYYSFTVRGTSLSGSVSFDASLTESCELQASMALSEVSPSCIYFFLFNII